MPIKKRFLFLVILILGGGLIASAAVVDRLSIYSSQFDALVLPQITKESAAYQKAQDTVAVSLTTLTETIPSESFLRKVEASAPASTSFMGPNNLLDPFQMGIWHLKARKDKRKNYLLVTASHTNPQKTTSIASLTSKILKEDLTNITNNPFIELKILNYPKEAQKHFLWLPLLAYFILGALAGAGLWLLGLLLIPQLPALKRLFKKNKKSQKILENFWQNQLRQKNLEPQTPLQTEITLLKEEKLPKMEPVTELAEDLTPKKVSKKTETEAKPKSNPSSPKFLKRPSEEEIKERLNRLINSEL